MLNKMKLKMMPFVVLVVLWGSAAYAVTAPFTENFVGFNQNWEDNVNNPATWVPAGGPDGSSYVSTQFNYLNFFSPFGGGPVTHRASASDGASLGSLIGDWNAAGVGGASAWVRHDAPEDLNFFLRVATAGNFPGAVISNVATVPSGVWTQISWGIDAFGANCAPEGGSCLSALQTVGNVQIGTDAPAGLIGNDVSYSLDLDQFALVPVPEPGTALLMALGLAGLSRAGRYEVKRS